MDVMVYSTYMYGQPLRPHGSLSVRGACRSAGVGAEGGGGECSVVVEAVIRGWWG